MPLKIYRRGDIWHYRGSVAGRRIRGSTGTASKTTAQRITAEREAREWKCRLDGPESVLTFSTAAMLYRSADKPTRFLDKVEDYWKDTAVKDISAGSVKQAAIVLYPNASAATRNRQVIVPTQSIINHAAELKLCNRIRVTRFQVAKTIKEPATWAWVDAFMGAANPHLGALACFMLLTGARITEALNVKWSDLDLTRSTAIIRATKIGEEREAHLPPALIVAIANIEGERTGTVFKYSSRSTAKIQWNAAIKRAGIKRLSFHACRHGFATALLHKNVDVITIAKLGGWKSPAHVFETYGHARGDTTLPDLIIDTPVTQSVDTDPKKKYIQ